MAPLRFLLSVLHTMRSCNSLFYACRHSWPEQDLPCSILALDDAQVCLVDLLQHLRLKCFGYYDLVSLEQQTVQTGEFISVRPVLLTVGDTSSLLSGHPLRITLLRAFSSKSFAVSRWNCVYFSGEMGKYDLGLIAFISVSETSCSFVFWRYDRLRVSATYKYFPGL